MKVFIFVMLASAGIFVLYETLFQNTQSVEPDVRVSIKIPVTVTKCADESCSEYTTYRVNEE